MSAEPAMAVLPVDLAARPRSVGRPGEPLFVSFWWQRLPLGAAAFAGAELPLSAGYLAGVTADLGARQLGARDEAIGGTPCAIDDGKLIQRVDFGAAAAAGDLIGRLDRLAAPAEGDASRLSVIVCTRDRLEDLARCLDRLLALVSPPGEIVVVDNSSSGSARALVAGKPPAIYVHEPRPGLSVARNAGVRASRGALIAFTDDDTEALPGWTSELSQAFRDAEIEAVTGLVLPAALDTAAQRYFQFAIGGFGGSGEFVPIRFDQEFLRRSRPHGVQVWRIGAGANMAFRRITLERVGLFDERLGAGAAGCSEDSEMLYRVLAAGGTCLFEPRAVVLHHHRAEWRALRRQMRAYMKGHGAALVAQYDRYGDAGNLKRLFSQLPRFLFALALRCLLEGRSQRLSLAVEEIAGWAAGLVYFVRPRWRRMRAVPQLARVEHAE